jgi:hypothetical protein
MFLRKRKFLHLIVLIYFQFIQLHWFRSVKSFKVLAMTFKSARKGCNEHVAIFAKIIKKSADTVHLRISSTQCSLQPSIV